MTDDPAVRVLMDHLGITSKAAEIWVDYIAKYTFGSFPLIFDLKRDLENLESLERLISGLEKCLHHDAMTMTARDELCRNLIFGRTLSENRSPSDLTREQVDYAKTTGREVLETVGNIEKFADQIRSAIKNTRRYIQNSPHSKKASGRMNLEGVQLVASSRFVWECETEKKAPRRALNEASAYGKFLYDLFIAFETEGNARAAFRLWSQLEDGRDVHS